jgi:hypothetical protein
LTIIPIDRSQIHRIIAPREEQKSTAQNLKLCRHEHHFYLLCLSLRLLATIDRTQTLRSPYIASNLPVVAPTTKCHETKAGLHHLILFIYFATRTDHRSYCTTARRVSSSLLASSMLTSEVSNEDREVLEQRRPNKQLYVSHISTTTSSYLQKALSDLMRQRRGRWRAFNLLEYL